MHQWLAFSFFSLFIYPVIADEKCGCGVVKYDSHYARALHLLDLSIRNAVFYVNSNFPSAAGWFYPPIELREDDDDNYPFEGQMSWEVVQSAQWDKDHLFQNKYILKPFLDQDRISIPAKIVREIEWTNNPYECEEYEYKERQVLDFNNNYSAIPQAFRLLKSDISMYYDKNISFLNARMRDISKGIDVYECNGISRSLVKKKTFIDLREKERSKCQERLSFADKKEAEALMLCAQSLDLCIANHYNPLAYVNRGLFYYLEGNSLDALWQLKAAFEKLRKSDYEEVEEEALSLKGKIELEAGLYADSIITLSELIKQYPKNKDAYFDRAEAWFEIGNFELSLEDYLKSHVRPRSISPKSVKTVAFSSGLIAGIIQGGVNAGVEFIPSLLSSLQGIGHGLWAFMQDPVTVSVDFVHSVQACVDFVRNNTPQDSLAQIVPELKELFEKWDEVGDERRGEITGSVIGKYGVDIFAGTGIVKAMKLYRDLKRANNVMTYEAMAISERNRILIKQQAAQKVQSRQQVLQSNLKIDWDKQGKHIEGHRNYLPEEKGSIFIHQDAQKLYNNFAGKGMKVNSHCPGMPGYQEVVDFKQFIGYAVDRNTGEKVATTWGKIHYAKDGVHIVPTKPRR